MIIKNYGEMLSKFKGFPCVGFVMFGEYNGDWVGLLDVGENIELWKGYFGSCSGCDFLEDKAKYVFDYELNEYAYDILFDDIKEYFKEERPFLSIPKSIIKNMSEKDFDEIFPANIRKDIYKFEEGKQDLFKTIKKRGIYEN